MSAVKRKTPLKITIEPLRQSRQNKHRNTIESNCLWDFFFPPQNATTESKLNDILRHYIPLYNTRFKTI